MNWRTTLLATLTLTGMALGQVPAPVISGGPTVSGTLHGAARISQIMSLYTATGSDLGQMTAASLEAGYNSTSQHHPFELSYSGGGIWSNQSTSNNTTFQNLELTQGFVTRKWNVSISDTVSYLPQAPTTGSSGIPGVGDLSSSLGFGAYIPGIVPSQSILTGYSPRVSNAVSGGLQYSLDGKTSLNGNSSFGLLRFVNGDGLDGTQDGASTGVNRRLDARNTIGVNYVYSRFQYDLSGFVIASHGGEATYTRRWSRHLKSDIRFGPQWTHSSDSRQLPDRTSLAGKAALAYTRGYTSANLHYVRGLNGGSGVSRGGISDSVQLGVSRRIVRVWTLALTGSYVRTGALLRTAGVTTTKYGGTQITRRLGRSAASAYISYTAIAQSAPKPSSGNVLNGLSHVFGIGFEYSPRELRLNGR